MSFNQVIKAYNNPNKREGLTAIVELVNKRAKAGSVFMLKREHMATAGLFHGILNSQGRMVRQSRIMGGTEETLCGFLAGVYLGYGLGENDVLNTMSDKEVPAEVTEEIEVPVEEMEVPADEAPEEEGDA